jgi:phospholipid-translocating ATPase
MFGYSTIFTSLPVFALVLDEDISRELVLTYPLLYISNQLGRALNGTRFCLWLFKSIYQGSVIMLLSIILFPHDNFVNVVAITFSSLVLTELLNIYSQIQRWKVLMVLAELFSLVAYLVSIVWLKSYFDVKMIVTADFFWKVLIITFIAWLPLHLTKMIKETVWPPRSKQIQEQS